MSQLGLSILLSFFFLFPAWSIELKEEFVIPSNSPSGERWHDRIQLSGILGVGTLHTDAGGALKSSNDGRYAGHVYLEGSLELGIHINRHVSGYFEWFSTGGKSPFYFNSGGSAKDKVFYLYEGYVHFQNLLHAAPELLQVKAGFIRIPFGEEYLWISKFDNPLINSTAANPWGNDEGVLFFGKLSTWSWFFSITDGSLRDASDKTSGQSDDFPSKAYNLKIAKQLNNSLFMSASAMYNDKYKLPGLWIASNWFPLSNTTDVSTGKWGIARFAAYEADLVAKLQKCELSANLGALNIYDETPGQNRNLTWGMLQYKHWLGNDYYAIGRLSQIAADQGYKHLHYDELGQDAGSFENYLISKSRLQIGFGYTPDKDSIYKIELSQDQYTIRDAPATIPNPNADARYFAGAEAIFRF